MMPPTKSWPPPRPKNENDGQISQADKDRLRRSTMVSSSFKSHFWRKISLFRLKYGGIVYPGLPNGSFIPYQSKHIFMQNVSATQRRAPFLSPSNRDVDAPLRVSQIRLWGSSQSKAPQSTEWHIGWQGLVLWHRGIWVYNHHVTHPVIRKYTAPSALPASLLVNGEEEKWRHFTVFCLELRARKFCQNIQSRLDIPRIISVLFGL